VAGRRWIRSRACGGLIAQWWSAQGGAEQVTDAVGDREAECAADQDAEDRAAGVAAADAGAERPVRCAVPKLDTSP
jgi:hypothetical protein